MFQDVGFRYPGRDDWAVRHVSFRLHPGERLAFVGENGAGKTTLIKLLARLYDPTEGRILLDGVDLRDYDLSRCAARSASFSRTSCATTYALMRTSASARSMRCGPISIVV